MKVVVLAVGVAMAMLVPEQSAAYQMNHSHCVHFERGAMTNSCGRDLDVTWCHSDSPTRCTDRWKSDHVRAGGRTTADYDSDDERRLFTLIFACDKDDGECLDARNEYRESKSS